MFEYLRVEYADGRVVEHDYTHRVAIDLNEVRPVTIWLVNPRDSRVDAAHQKVCPYVGAVYVGYTDV